MNEFKRYSNNIVRVSGKAVSQFKYSHTLYGENFHTVFIEVNRASGNADMIPLMVSDRVFNVNDNVEGKYLSAKGQFRSYNKHSEDGKSTLVLHVFVSELHTTEGRSIPTENNEVCIEGNICKETVYRKTPSNREVCDVMVAINRTYQKSDYIPCIVWGRNAKFTSTLSVSTTVRIGGRIQSRTFKKKDSNGEYVDKTVYEISVSSIEVVPEEGSNEIAE